MADVDDMTEGGPRTAGPGGAHARIASRAGASAAPPAGAPTTATPGPPPTSTRPTSTGPTSTRPAHLDHASSTPLHPVAREALLAALDDGWADPDRLYASARRARLLLDGARDAVAGVLGVRADELAFTHGGVQAVHLAVLGALRGRRRAGQGLVASAVEHSAVLHAGEWHVAAGGELRLVPVGRTARVDLDAWSDAVSAPGVALAVLQCANHEVGTLQPVADAARAAAEHGVPLHSDLTHALGCMPLPPVPADILTADAATYGGPPGIGFLAVRKGTRWRSPGPADERERGRVPGRPDLPAVVAAAAGLVAAAGEAEREAERRRGLVERLRMEVPRLVPDVELLGSPDERLPHLVAFSCLYVDGEALLHELDRAGIAVSSGSSCTSSTVTPSHVLEAMGVLTHGNVRVSVGRTTTSDDVDRLLRILPDAVARVRAMAGAGGL